MPVAYECDECETAWPSFREYAVCPRCRVRTRTTMVKSVLTAGEAQKERLYIQFDRECQLRDEKRERLGKPSPEEIGRQEAAKLAAAWREAVTEIGELRPPA